MHRVICKIVTLLVGIVPLALFGTTPPALQISDNSGNSVLIDSTPTRLSHLT
jgi:hypothetical protein